MNGKTLGIEKSFATLSDYSDSPNQISGGKKEEEMKKVGRYC